MESSLLDLIELIRKDIGWLFALTVIFYEILWPYWETKFQDKINELLSPLRKDIDEVDKKVSELDEKQTHQIQVTRAMARENEGIDDERVDQYLVKNGVQVDEFIIDEDNNE